MGPVYFIFRNDRDLRIMYLLNNKYVGYGKALSVTRVCTIPGHCLVVSIAEVAGEWTLISIPVN